MDGDDPIDELLVDPLLLLEGAGAGDAARSGNARGSRGAFTNGGFDTAGLSALDGEFGLVDDELSLPLRRRPTANAITNKNAASASDAKTVLRLVSRTALIACFPGLARDLARW